MYIYIHIFNFDIFIEFVLSFFFFFNLNPTYKLEMKLLKVKQNLGQVRFLRSPALGKLTPKTIKG